MQLYSRKQIASARKIAKKAGVNSLLSDSKANPKTTKNGKVVGVDTAPLHLAPGKLSGFQVCPMASAGCLAACLHTAGNPLYMSGKQKARLARTRLYFQNRDVFLTILYAEIIRHIKRAEDNGMIPGIRLNATSDIAWESVKLPNGKTLFEEFPQVSFYDYTAIPRRMQKFLDDELPSNYFLTFSVKENNYEVARNFVFNGATASIVFNVRPGRPLPASYDGLPVIDADVHDYRPDDPAGHWAGLRAKGDAIGDTSGFVHDVS